MNPLYENMKVSVFERMSLAAAKHGAVNLGQGFPDFGWPEEILDAAARVITVNPTATLRAAARVRLSVWPDGTTASCARTPATLRSA